MEMTKEINRVINDDSLLGFLLKHKEKIFSVKIPQFKKLNIKDGLQPLLDLNNK